VISVAMLGVPIPVAARPPGTAARFAPGRYDVGVGVARAVGHHLLIAGGLPGHVNRDPRRAG